MDTKNDLNLSMQANEGTSSDVSLEEKIMDQLEGTINKEESARQPTSIEISSVKSLKSNKTKNKDLKRKMPSRLTINLLQIKMATCYRHCIELCIIFLLSVILAFAFVICFHEDHKHSSDFASTVIELKKNSQEYGYTTMATQILCEALQLDTPSFRVIVLIGTVANKSELMHTVQMIKKNFPRKYAIRQYYPPIEYAREINLPFFHPNLIIIENLTLIYVGDTINYIKELENTYKNRFVTVLAIFNIEKDSDVIQTLDIIEYNNIIRTSLFNEHIKAEIILYDFLSKDSFSMCVRKAMKANILQFTRENSKYIALTLPKNTSSCVGINKRIFLEIVLQRLMDIKNNQKNSSIQANEVLSSGASLEKKIENQLECTEIKRKPSSQPICAAISPSESLDVQTLINIRNNVNSNLQANKETSLAIFLEEKIEDQLKHTEGKEKSTCNEGSSSSISSEEKIEDQLEHTEVKEIPTSQPTFIAIEQVKSLYVQRLRDTKNDLNSNMQANEGSSSDISSKEKIEDQLEHTEVKEEPASQLTFTAIYWQAKSFLQRLMHIMMKNDLNSNMQANEGSSSDISSEEKIEDQLEHTEIKGVPASQPIIDLILPFKPLDIQQLMDTKTDLNLNMKANEKSSSISSEEKIEDQLEYTDVKEEPASQPTSTAIYLQAKSLFVQRLDTKNDLNSNMQANEGSSFDISSKENIKDQLEYTEIKEKPASQPTTAATIFLKSGQTISVDLILEQLVLSIYYFLYILLSILFGFLIGLSYSRVLRNYDNNGIESGKAELNISALGSQN
ncbi:uncharacterized protein LOC114254861 [Monomorium pharaonis]|uniref:uncharacterized protein LOC114254861 n=1 Tax=Monomorium pharaonis TaxID=307658 RepID=UPI00102E10CD|nr:uncharacterized protein LOC114254861 [Monomorium pharaonis]